MPKQRPTSKQPEPATRSYRQDQLEALLQPDVGPQTTWNTATVAFEAIATLGSHRETTAAKLACSSGDAGVRVRAGRHLWLAGFVSLALVFGASVSFVVTSVRQRMQTSQQLPARAAIPPQADAAATSAAAPPSTAPAPMAATRAPARNLDAHAEVPPPRAPGATRAAPSQHPAPSKNSRAASKPTPKELAIAAIALGRDAEAIAAYRALASAEPGNPVFATIASILEHRASARCKQLRESGASACSASAE